MIFRCVGCEEVFILQRFAENRENVIDMWRSEDDLQKGMCPGCVMETLLSIDTDSICSGVTIRTKEKKP